MKVPNNNTILGKIIRLPLKIIPDNFSLRVLSGTNKGLKWIKGSGVSSYWIGSYESDKQEAIKSLLKEGMTFYDIGAHTGFYSLLAASRVGKNGHVLSIEPSDRNIKYLERNVYLNHFEGIVQIIKGAAGSKSGTTHFYNQGNNAGGFVSLKGNTVVPSVTIDGLVEDSEYIPDVIKIDVQGYTKEVLSGANKTIEKYHPTLVIAIDNGKRPGQKHFTKSSIHKYLKNFGYNITDIHRKTIPNNQIEEQNEILVTYKP